MVPKPPLPSTPTGGVKSDSGRSALLVGVGIFLSRIAGLVRTKAMSHYLGTGLAADAFSAAFRIPNILQNMLGEGALSSSFIPVYAGLLARGENREADRVAGAVGALLALISAPLVALGVVAAPALVWMIAPGLDEPTAALTLPLVRVLFPGAGLLVVSAWCLGILNSHRRFLLSYTAPVLWNAAMIAALVGFGWRQPPEVLVNTLAVASVIGSALQFAVQVPAVLAVAPHMRPALDLANEHVRTVIRNFGPGFIGRGVMQISSLIDQMLSSLLPSGSIAVFQYATALYTLPVSLFGMAVSAAELPAMSSATGTEAEVARWLRDRLAGGLQRIAFFVIPSAVVFVLLGDTVAAAIFQSGEFTRADTVRVWVTLAGSSVGLLAQTWGRLYSSTFYALRDTRTPLRTATVRVAITGGLGWWMATQLPALLGIDPTWGIAGLTASAGIAGWVEYVLLKHLLDLRVGRTGVPHASIARLWAAAGAAGLLAIGAKTLASDLHPIVAAVVVIGPFGVAYLGLTHAMGFAEAAQIFRRLRLPRRS